MAAAVIPFSNPAGKNQFTGGPQLPKGSPMNTIPGSPASMQSKGGVNPYAQPVSANPGNTGTGFTPTSTQQGFITSGTDAGQNALQKQLTDIYGQGTGGSLFTLLNSMSGTDSTVLQEYIASLAPQEATAQANVNAGLGAGGVSANSSVAALADANLAAQEQASIASESAALTQNQEQLTASILEGTEGASAKEVATSGWSIFGNVMNDVTSDIGNIIHGNSGGQGGGSGGGGGGGGGASAGDYATTMGTQPAQLSSTGTSIVGGGDMYDPTMNIPAFGGTFGTDSD